MKKLAAILLVVFTIVSCSKNDDNNTENITVDLTVSVDGTLSNTPEIEYRDSDGAIKTETLTGDFNKSIIVESGFKLSLKATGTIDGTIILTAKADGNGNSFTDTKNANFQGTAGDFDLLIATTLQ